MEEEVKNESTEKAKEVVLSDFAQFLQSKYPEVDFSDNENVHKYGKQNADECEKELSFFKGIADNIKCIVDNHPEVGEIFVDLVSNKMPVRACIAKHFSSEELVPSLDDEDYEEWQKAEAERTRRRKEWQENEAKLADNEKITYENIDKYVSEKNLTPEQKDALVEAINRAFESMMKKLVSPEMLVAFGKMLNYDKDVAEALEAGKVNGRNEIIKAKFETDEKEQKGDGMPQQSKRGGYEAKMIKGSKPVFDFNEILK